MGFLGGTQATRLLSEFAIASKHRAGVVDLAESKLWGLRLRIED